LRSIFFLSVVVVLIVAFWMILVRPAVEAAQETAKRGESYYRMSLIVFALHQYEDTHNSLPAHASYDAKGQPLLSWRVHILPYLEETEGNKLYQEFHLDEPWDSPHNRQLIARMPGAYQNPSLSKQAGLTNYLAVVGNACVFNGSKEGSDLEDISDGLENTILLVEADADQAVEWTRPADWEFDPSQPKSGLGSIRSSGIWIAAWADGQITQLVRETDEQVLKDSFTRDGKEVFDRSSSIPGFDVRHRPP
jgi:hypothetical protein